MHSQRYDTLKIHMKQLQIRCDTIHPYKAAFPLHTTFGDDSRISPSSGSRTVLSNWSCSNRYLGIFTMVKLAQEGAVEELALGLGEQRPAGLSYEPPAGLPYSLPADLPYSLPEGLGYSLPAGLREPRTTVGEEEPQTAVGLRGPQTAAGLREPLTGAGAADGGRLAWAANGSGLVLARARTLPRHRKIPSLQLSPEVSGRSTG